MVDSASSSSSSSSGSGLERIDAANGDDVETWARKLDVSPTQIRDAIAKVGDRAEEVEMHLKGSRSTTNADQAARAGGAGSAS